jgi:hypothetical protein
VDAVIKNVSFPKTKTLVKGAAKVSVEYSSEGSFKTDFGMIMGNHLTVRQPNPK